MGRIMSIYTRSYMRDDALRPPRAFDMVKWILIVLAAAFVLQSIVSVWIGGRTAQTVLSYFWLDRNNITRGLFYTPITYGLLHRDFFHLLFNGLGIYFAGRVLQARLGPVRVLEVFLLSVILGGLTWLLVSTSLGRSGVLLGASAGCFGFLSLFALYYWHETIRFYFWFIPVALRGQQIFLILLGLQAFFFLFSELAPGARSGSVAYSAHLAGFGAGYLYFKVLDQRRTLWEIVGPNRQRSRNRGRRKAAVTKRFMGRYSVNLRGKPAPELRKEVDRILDKINTMGFGSLSEDEKNTLDSAKDTLK